MSALSVSNLELKDLSKSKKLSEIFDKISSKVCEGWNPIVKPVCDGMVSVTKFAIATFDAIVSFVGNLMAMPLNGLEKISEAIETGDLDTAMYFINMWSFLEFGLTAIVDVLNVRVVGSGIDLSGIRNYIDKVFRANEIFSQIISIAYATGVYTKLRYLMNAKYTPNIYSPQDAYKLYIAGRISEAEFRETLKKHGWSEEAHDNLYWIFSVPPSIPLIARMYQLMDLPEEVVKDWLANQGIDIKNEWEYYKQYFMLNALRDEFSKYETALKDGYRRGIISKNDLQNILSKIKARPFEVSLALGYLDMLKKIYLTEIYVDKHIYLLRRKRIKCSDLEQRLGSLLADKAIAQAIAMRECAYLGYDYPSEDVQF